MIRRALLIVAASFWPLITVAADATASDDLPWNEPLEILKNNLTGPTATVIILIALAFGFAVWAFSDDNRGLFRAFKAVVALAVVGALGSGFLASLGVSGALL